MSKRIILAIEGIDGAGKTTLINQIKHYYHKNVILYQRTLKGNLTDKFVSSKVMKKYHLLQFPLYLLLSYKNYLLFKFKDKGEPIIILDRCFLSNICYFFPEALTNNLLLKKLLKFEVKLFPNAIFILDVDPIIGHSRDNQKKSLNWLINTRNAYLNASNSSICSLAKIEIIATDLSIEQKFNIIIQYIQGELNNGN